MKMSLLLTAALSSIGLTAANVITNEVSLQMTNTSRQFRRHNSFFDAFDEGEPGLLKNWWFSGFWGNGQPFNVGFDPSYHKINQHNVLELFVKKEPFYHHTGNYPWTAGELRSKGFYGAGCYSTCMKPSGESGVSSSFYIFSGFWDSEYPRDPTDPNLHFHNEIDIEFVGRDNRAVQTNYFARQSWRVDPNMDGSSGVEWHHPLWYDASSRFESYSIRWASWGIQWYVGPHLIRTVYRKDDPNMPDPNYGNMRFSANTWTVVPQAEGWAGRPRDDLYETKAAYAWMAFESGDKCKIKSACGF